MNTRAALAALLAVSCPALAQQPVSPTYKLSWSENCGWMDWAGAGSPAGSQAARVWPTFLSGFVWCENIGWLSLGDGTPGAGTSYTNTSGADFGVNIVPVTKFLSGYAWGENVGWINFAAAAPLGSVYAARIDPTASRLRGYAWGENIGWINLDDAAHFVAIACYANCDESTTAPVLNVLDFACFLNKFAAGDTYANCDNSTTPPALNVLDFACFLNKFAAGCP